MVVLAATAGFIAPYDPLETDYEAMLARPDAKHWLGTDAFGRDVLSRIVYCSRTALMVGLAHRSSAPARLGDRVRARTSAAAWISSCSCSWTSCSLSR